MKMLTYSLRAKFARRIPDPVLDHCHRHILLCAVESLPPGLPLEKANVRPQNTNRKVYREVAKHLRNENDEGARNIFHLKNKGITILAHKVEQNDEDQNEYVVSFDDESQGIVDGGHTYTIIMDNRDAIRAKNKKVLKDESLSDEEKRKLATTQFVKIEILTGLSTGVTTEIARGLNTAVQVQEQTLANHDGKFDWIKDDLKHEPYFSRIAFRESEDGLLDVTDVLRILELFNITDYPNDGSSRNPIRAYTGKENVLASYLKDSQPFLKLRPLLKDLLVLHDTISHQARDLWNLPGSKRKGASLAFIDTADKAPFEFPFIGKTGQHRLFRGALFPMLAAFRWMVVEDQSTGLVRWRKDFPQVLNMWVELAEKLIAATRDTSDELGRKADAVGKSSNHWKNLYNEVAIHQMRMEA